MGDVGIVADERLDDAWIIHGEDEDRLVDGISEHPGHQHLTPFVRGPHQSQMLGPQRCPPLDVVVGEVVEEHPVGQR